MTFEQFLAVFRALDEQGAVYVLTGAFAQAMHGRVVGTEQIEILVAKADANRVRVAEAFDFVWGDAAYRTCTRVLPPSTPLMFELIACDAMPPHELLDVYGTLVRVTPFDASYEPALERSHVRDGYTLIERQRAIDGIVARLALPVPAPRGVRKYRSFEDLVDDRELSKAAHVARIRAARTVRNYS
jgi:hypothetical protein